MLKKPPSLTLERLKEVLTYDPLTGLFTWNAGGRKHKNGDIAGYSKDGYIYITIDYKSYGAHRLAWFYVHDVWPTHNIDHKYGIRDDNRISELRDVTHAVNLQGFRSLSSHSKTGYTGVSWDARLKGFRAARMTDGKSKFLGVFDTAEEAADAYINAGSLAPADPKQYRERRHNSSASRKTGAKVADTSPKV